MIRVILILLLFSGCNIRKGSSQKEHSSVKITSLIQARRGFVTTLTKKNRIGVAAVKPPDESGLTLVTYPTALGPMAAYVSKPPSKGRHPAIIWVFGTFYNSITSVAWEPVAQDRDMSARAFRDAGVITMYPSTRGGNNNPGYVEALYGEVDDILHARAYLAKQPFVDPRRIYVGGHSTGGSMVLLLAAAESGWRGVISIGPAAYTKNYGAKALPYDVTKSRENTLRSPARWLHLIRSPTFVFEGTKEPTNVDVLDVLKRTSSNPQIHYFKVFGKDHFSCITPVTRAMASLIIRDTDLTRAFTVNVKRLQTRLGKENGKR